MIQKKMTLLLIVLLSAAAFQSCMTNLANKKPLPQPYELIVPQPIEGNSGKYFCPYTADSTVAPWVEKGRAARTGKVIGGTLGQESGKKLASKVPFVGGLLGRAVGDKLGKEAAIKLSGGWGYIRETSDLSFNRMDDMVVYLYANYAANEHLPEVRRVAGAIYPELIDQRFWDRAIRNARAGQ